MWVVIVPSRHALKNIFYQIVVIGISLSQINFAGIHNKQWRIFIVVEKLGIGIIKFLQIRQVDAPFNTVATKLNSVIQCIGRSL
jgi:hypothetical protein